MKPLLAALVAFGAGLALLLALAGAQTAPSSTCGTQDVQACDLDGDGVVSILDLSIMAQHFTEQVGTPYPCLPSQYFATPHIVYTIDGTPEAAVVNRIAIPTTDPRYGPNLAGTPVRVTVC